MYHTKSRSKADHLKNPLGLLLDLPGLLWYGAQKCLKWAKRPFTAEQNRLW